MALDNVSARPDFLVLVYPVITMREPYASASSREALLGRTPPAETIARLSTDEQVTGRTSPSLLVHGGTDRSVPAGSRPPSPR